MYKEIDYSKDFKHITIKERNKTKTSKGDIIASIQGNNFGDQIIHFRMFDNLGVCDMGIIQGYRQCYIITNYEGEHWQLSDMKLFINHNKHLFKTN